MGLASLACGLLAETLNFESQSIEAQFPLEPMAGLGIYTKWNEDAGLSVTGQSNDVDGATDCYRLYLNYIYSNLLYVST